VDGFGRIFLKICGSGLGFRFWRKVL